MLNLLLRAIPVIGTIFVARKIWKEYKFSDNVNMAVLGMPASGKTTWINFLRGKEDNGEYNQTFAQDKVKSFTTDLGDGHQLTINEFYDISGSNEYVMPMYEKMIHEASLILFLFDSQKFYTEKEYKEEVVDRIAKIHDFLPNDEKEKQVFIVPTHKDTLEAEGKFKETLYRALMEDESTKVYASPDFITGVFQTNEKGYLVNLRDIVFAKYKKA